MNWTTADTMARTVPFRDVLHAAAIDVGMLPDQDLDHGTSMQLTRGINTAARYAWEYHDWPESRVVAEVPCDPHPVRGGRFVPRQMASGLRLATVFGFFSADPLTEKSAAPVAWKLGPDGYYPQCYDPLTVWADYRTDALTYDSREWDETLLYPAGTVRYQPEDGHCYRSAAGTKGVIPGRAGQTGVLHAATGTQAAYYEVTEDGVTPIPDTVWTPQPVLWILQEAIISGAVATFTRTEGQYGSASVHSDIMAGLLDAQILLTDNQMGATKTYRH